MFSFFRKKLTSKVFQIVKRVETRGVFITQVRTVIVDTLEARTQEEANEQAKLLHGKNSYAIPHISN